MTLDTPRQVQAAASSTPVWPTARIVTRQQARDCLVRLCESVLRQMARRRTH